MSEHQRRFELWAGSSTILRNHWPAAASVGSHSGLGGRASGDEAAGALAVGLVQILDPKVSVELGVPGSSGERRSWPRPSGLLQACGSGRAVAVGARVRYILLTDKQGTPVAWQRQCGDGSRTFTTCAGVAALGPPRACQRHAHPKQHSGAFDVAATLIEP